jgi:hypothetical protein
MSTRAVGGKHIGIVGGYLEVTCTPNSALKTLIDGYITNETPYINLKLVAFTFSNNWEVAIASDDGIYDGIICEAPIKHKASPYYYLTVRVFSVVNANGTRWTPRQVQCLPYSGTIALQNTTIVNGATAVAIDTGGTGGYGVVMAKDVPTGFVDVMF